MEPQSEAKAESKPTAKVEAKPEAEIEPKPEAKVQPPPDAKIEPKTETKAKTPSDLTPQIVERVHALYEQLGREEVGCWEATGKTSLSRRLTVETPKYP